MMTFLIPGLRMTQLLEGMIFEKKEDKNDSNIDQDGWSDNKEIEQEDKKTTKKDWENKK